MWKWIAAIVAFVILALVGTCYVGYRKLANTGDTVVVTIPGSAERVFAFLSDRDSLTAWLPSGAELIPNDHGPMRTGDTIRISTPGVPGDSSKRQWQVWVVREIVPPVTLAVDGIEPSPTGVPRVALARRDSLVSTGDSTTILSTFQVFAAGIGDNPNRMAAATLRTADGLRLAAAKAQWRGQLRKLAAHLAIR
jgi:uncharacterized protein YndB with AHSA1/START domain